MKKLLKMFRYPGYDRYIPDCDTCELVHTTECDQYRCQARINARLGEYEHTGCTPEDISEMIVNHEKLLYHRDELLRQLDATTAKFDAALADMRLAGDEHDLCVVCAHVDTPAGRCDEAYNECKDCVNPCTCKDCRDGSNWEWRGTP